MWLLRHACPGSHNQALTGDLVEKFREGRSRSWFSKQVLIAIAVGVLGEVRRYWPHFSYAVAETVMPAFLGKTVNGRWVLSWPWSQFVQELIPDALLTLAALPVLAAALVINGAFRWVSLVRTGMISLALITLELYLDVFPWIHPAVANREILFFSTFLVSAWLGCLSPRHANELEK